MFLSSWRSLQFISYPLVVDPALPKKFSQRDSAMPPDVRKRSALPSIGSMNLGLRPKTWA